MTDKQEPTQPSSSEPQHSPLGPQYSIDPRLLSAMYDMARDDDIDLLAYWGIIKKRKKPILIAMLVAALLSAGISLLIPNHYEAKVQMAPVVRSGRGAGASGLAASLGGSLGGLASLAGGGLEGNTDALQNLTVLQSRAFLWSFVNDNKLMPILFADAWDAAKKVWKKSDPKDQPNLWDAYRKFTRGKLLTVSVDKKSGVVSVVVDWTNPVQASEWANQLVARLNDYLRKKAIARSEASLKYLNEAVQKTSLADVRQALFSLIAQEQKKAMIANTQKEYAFRVLDAAAPPDKKAWPSRVLIVLLSMLAAGIVAVIFVVIQENMRQGGQDEGVNQA